MPFDSSSPTVTVRPGSRVRVELVRPPTVVRRIVDAARLHGRSRPAPVRHPVRIAPHDIGTYYVVDSDNSSGYRETDTEISTQWREADKAQIRNDYLANIYRTTVGGSGRSIENTARFQGGSDETDGLITAVTMKRDGYEKRFDFIGATQTWTEQVPAALRLAALAALPAGPSDAIVDGVAAGIGREALESWDVNSRHRTSADGTLVCSMLDGKYRLGISSARYYYPFDTADTTTYKITAEPAFERAEVPAVDTLIGDTVSTEIDLWLVPQTYQTLIQWYARFLYITLFSFGYFIIPNTGAYLARLPYYPQQYSLTLAGSVTNAVAMSNRIRQTRTYAAMIRADLALQVFSAYFMLILVDRFNGRWTLYQKDIPAGQLCGVIRYRFQGGPPVVQYVWRRETLARPFVAVDSGQLNVPGEVTGDDGSIIVVDA